MLKKRRYTASPSKEEVNVKAIQMMSPPGWRLLGSDTVPLIGTVPKDYLCYGDIKNKKSMGFIAKKGRMESIIGLDCVTEEIISKIGDLLPLEMAQSKLTRLSKTDIRFLSKDFKKRDQEELIHGIEIAAKFFDTSPDDVETAFQLKESTEEKLFYSLSNVMDFFNGVFKNHAEQLRFDFIKMVAFDAFIGAPDRHAMNWGVLVSHESSQSEVRFSPVFDTARGLFREISDRDLKEKIERQGKSGFIEQYANRSKPILSIDNSVDLNHFGLIKCIFDENKFNDQDALLTIFKAVDICNIRHMLQLKFRRIITQFRIGLVCDLLTYRINRIAKDLQL